MELGEAKMQGGLGIKDLSSFNKALVLISHIWDYCHTSDSLWIKWMNVYYFRDSCLWSLSEKSSYSCAFEDYSEIDAGRAELYRLWF